MGLRTPKVPPHNAHELSAQGRARLLDMTYARLVFSVHAALVFVAPFLAWLIYLKSDARALTVWLLCYVAAVFAIRVNRHSYQADRLRLTDTEMVSLWTPRIHGIALVHGFGLGLLTALTLGRGPFEFAMLMLVGIIGVVSANATHQTPVFGAFQRFFVACWGTTLVLLPWSFPRHWPFILPLALLYTVAIYRHARFAHGFFLQQVRLEDEGVRLAESHRIAKVEAERALREKNQFLATASHDLRQPVQAMGFLIESIAQRNHDPGLTPALDDLRRSIRSVHGMFNSLLDLSKIESGIVQVSYGPVALRALFNDIATLFGEEVRSRGLALRVWLPRSEAIAWADAPLLHQSLVNLVHNAMRYTAKGGILVGARRRGSDWLIEVWDTGIGVANEEQPQLYAPYFRGELSWHVDSAGHGLGLAVVARCAQLMKMTYGLTSRVGRGSRFWLRVPAASRPGKPAEVGLPVNGPARFAQLRGACLVVEDDPDLSAAWVELLRTWGVDVRCASCATDAFATLDETFMPSAILCDLRLRSGESGFAVLKALFERCSEASGALISGELYSDELRQAENEGFLVLRKPLAVEELHALLARWLDPAFQSLTEASTNHATIPGGRALLSR